MVDATRVLRIPVLLRVFTLLCLVSGVLGPGISPPLVAAQRAGTVDDPDLAAMTLTPADLDAMGFEGYRLDFGRMRYQDDLAPFLADILDVPIARASDALDEAGFARWYESVLFLPGDEDDPLSDVPRNVHSYILEFGDEDGAIAMWDVMADEAGEGTVEELPRVAAFGDATRATREEGEEGEGIDLTFRLGNLHAGVVIVDRSGEAPDLADAEALADILEERVETVLADGGPGLGNQALRLTGDEIDASEDTYLLLNGEGLHFYHESTSDLRQREDEADDAGITEEYIVWQILAPLQAGANDDIWYFLSLRRFDDDEAASAWLAGTEDRSRDRPAYTNFEIDEEAQTLGDESVMSTVDAADYPFSYRSLAIRVGSVVVTIDLQAPEAPPSAPVEALAEAQIACLEDGGCTEPQAVPDAVEAFIEDMA